MLHRKDLMIANHWWNYLLCGTNSSKQRSNNFEIWLAWSLKRLQSDVWHQVNELFDSWNLSGWRCFSVDRYWSEESAEKEKESAAVIPTINTGSTTTTASTTTTTATSTTTTTTGTITGSERRRWRKHPSISIKIRAIIGIASVSVIIQKLLVAGSSFLARFGRILWGLEPIIIHHHHFQLWEFATRWRLLSKLTLSTIAPLIFDQCTEEKDLNDIIIFCVLCCSHCLTRRHVLSENEHIFVKLCPISMKRSPNWYHWCVLCCHRSLCHGLNYTVVDHGCWTRPRTKWLTVSIFATLMDILN